MPPNSSNPTYAHPAISSALGSQSTTSSNDASYNGSPSQYPQYPRLPSASSNAIIAALTPSTSMSGSSPGSGSHKRKASDLEEDSFSHPQGQLPPKVAPSYSLSQTESPTSSTPASGSVAAAPPSNSNDPGQSGSRSNTMDSFRSNPNNTPTYPSSNNPSHSSSSGSGSNSTPTAKHEQQQPPHIPQLQVTGHHGLQSNTGGNKRIKTARACDSCRRKKIRCDVIEDGSAPGDPNNGNSGLTCAHCRQYGFECTFFLPITETRFKKKREREREAELAAKAAAARPPLLSGPSPLGSPYSTIPGGPAGAAALYRTSSGGSFFTPGGGSMASGSSTGGIPVTIARHLPPTAGPLGPGPSSAPLSGMVHPLAPGAGAAGAARYASYESSPPLNSISAGGRIASQEWPPPPPLPLPSAGGSSLGQVPSVPTPSYRSTWREVGKGPLVGESAAASGGYYGGGRDTAPVPPRKDSPGQRPDASTGSVLQPPDARVLGPTSIAYIVHSHPFVPGAAIEAHDIKHHQTFEVGASGDGIIKFNRPPRRTSAASGEDDEQELTAATEVALAANAAEEASSVSGGGAAAGGAAEGSATAVGDGDGGSKQVSSANTTLIDIKAKTEKTLNQHHLSAANSPSVGSSGIARVRLAADVAEKLANVYFSNIANMFPVVTKAEFLHLSPPPPILLYAVCAVAALSRDVPREVLLCVKTSLSAIFRDSDVLSTSKSVTVRALLVLSLHSDVHGSTAMQSGARCWNRTGCAVRMAQDLGLHRDATGRDDEDDDQFFLEQKRRIWGCCVTADRILSISLGHPLAIDLTDCDVRLPSPYEVKRWADDPSADPSTDRPFAFNTEMLKLSILFGRVMKTIYSPTGLMKTTDEEIGGLLRDIDTWMEMLPVELQFCGPESSPTAGILHVAFACLQMLFWRVFLRISYICPAHLKFSLNIERMTLLIKWSREAILWVDRNEFYLDTLQLVSYSLVFCATVQYHAWVRRGEKEALGILKLCRDCVNRFKRPGGEEGEDLSMRAKTAGVIGMLYEAASGVYAGSPVGSQLNPTAGVFNRRAVETLRGIVFRADSARPGGGVYVAANQAHLLQDLPTGTIIHEDVTSALAAAAAAAAGAGKAGAGPGGEVNGGAGAADKANGGGGGTWNTGAPDGNWPAGAVNGAGGSMQQQQGGVVDGGNGGGTAFMMRPRRGSKSLGSAFTVPDGLTSFQIPPEAGMGRALTAHISENGPIQLELQQPPFIPAHSGPPGLSMAGNGGGGDSSAQNMNPFGLSNATGGGGSSSSTADPNMAFLQSAMNVNPLLNDLHWPSQSIMIAGGAEFDGMGVVSSMPAGGSVAMNGVGPGHHGGNNNNPTSSMGAAHSTEVLAGANGNSAGENSYGGSSGSMMTGQRQGQQQTHHAQPQEYVFDNTNHLGGPQGQAQAQGQHGMVDASGASMMGIGAFDPSVLDGLPVSGLDFGAWDNFFSRFGVLYPNAADNSNGSGAGGSGMMGGGASTSQGDLSGVPNGGYGGAGGGGGTTF
ncbi:hypothetical protein CF319_g3672 [Tilletia indica]|nr:hypothetical protein CF319_g3672 [Tilletia indica]